MEGEERQQAPRRRVRKNSNTTQRKETKQHQTAEEGGKKQRHPKEAAPPERRLEKQHRPKEEEEANQHHQKEYEKTATPQKKRKCWGRPSWLGLRLAFLLGLSVGRHSSLLTLLLIFAFFRFVFHFCHVFDFFPDGVRRGWGRL